MKHAWLVDNEREVLQAMRLMLAVLDWKVTTFLTARAAAKALLDGEQPDVLILDLNLDIHDVSGRDMLEFIRRHPKTRSLPVVMLSNEDSEVVVDELYRLGANAYLCKPVTLEELERVLQHVASLRR